MSVSTANRGRWMLGLIRASLATITKTQAGRSVTLLSEPLSGFDAKTFPYLDCALLVMTPTYGGRGGHAWIEARQTFYVACGDRSGKTGDTALDDLLSDVQDCVEQAFEAAPLDGKTQAFRGTAANKTVSILRVEWTQNQRITLPQAAAGESILEGVIIFNQVPFATAA